MAENPTEKTSFLINSSALLEDDTISRLKVDEFKFLLEIIGLAALTKRRLGAIEDIARATSRDKEKTEQLVRSFSKLGYIRKNHNIFHLRKLEWLYKLE